MGEDRVSFANLNDISRGHYFMKKNLKPAIAIAFLAGYFVNGVIVSFISEARADIYGMDYYDLKSDYDFKRAVMTIVEENCATSIRRSDLRTWHWCGSNSSYKP